MISRKLLRPKLNFAGIILSILITLFVSNLLPADLAYAEQITLSEENEKLEISISKGYSNKFCNAVAMGVSKETALKMSINENSKPLFNPGLWKELIVSGDSKIKEVSNEKIAETAASQASRLCGSALGISGQDAKEMLKSDFLQELTTKTYDFPS